MKRRRIFVILLASFAFCIWFVFSEQDPAFEGDSQSSIAANAGEIFRAPSLPHADSLTRDALPIQSVPSVVEVSQEPPLADPKIVGHVFNKLSGQRFRAWVVLFKNGEESQSADCFADQPFEFEVERGHDYQLFVKKIVEEEGFRQEDSPWKPTQEARMASANYLVIPVDSKQLVWEIDLEVYRKGSVHGRILAPDGSPIVGAQFQILRVENLDSPVSRGKGVVNGLGAFQKSFGESKRVILRFDFSQAHEMSHRNLMPPKIEGIQLLEGQVMDLGDFKATRGAAKLHGKIIDQYGEAYSGLIINCHLVDRTRFAVVGSVVTHEDGGFEFSALGIGTYEIDLTPQFYARNLLEHMRFAWGVSPIRVEIDSPQQKDDLGRLVVPRPISFRQKVEIEGGVKESYSIQIETVPDFEIERSIQRLAQQHPQKEAIKGWAPPPPVAPFDWLISPPWFNYRPEITVLYEQAAIREIACRLPHAPIRIRVFESVDGVVGGESEVIVYPSLSAEPVVVVPKPN